MSKSEQSGRLADLDSRAIWWCLNVSDDDRRILEDWNGESPMTLGTCLTLADLLEEDDLAPNEIAERVRERATVDRPGTVVSEQHATVVAHLETAGERLGFDTTPMIKELAAANREGRRPNIPKEAIYEILREAQQESGEFNETFELLETWYHA